MVLVNDPKVAEKVREIFPRLSKASSSRLNLRDGNAVAAGKAAAQSVNFSQGSLN